MRGRTALTRRPSPYFFGIPHFEYRDTLLQFILRRVSLIIPTFFGITLLTFLLVRLIPGDPIEALAGERGIDPVQIGRAHV